MEKIKCLIILLIVTISSAFDDFDYCEQVAQNFQLENNVSVTSSSRGISNRLFIVSVQNGNGGYGKMNDRCVITINKSCTAFFECAGNKAKLLHSIFTSKVNSRYGILMLDGDSAVKNRFYLDKLYNSKRILSLRPESKRWSTAGMYWPMNSLKYEQISVLLEKLRESGRDDVAFQSVKEGRLKGLNEHYIYHARGNDILGKNAVLKVRLSSTMNGISLILTLLFFFYNEKKTVKKTSRIMIYAVVMTAMSGTLDKIISWFIIFITKGMSRYPLANDSRFKWYNSVSLSLAICWQSNIPIVRQDLYGTFHEISMFQSFLLLAYLAAKDFGLSILLSAYLLYSIREYIEVSKVKSLFYFQIRILLETVFTSVSILITSIMISLLTYSWYWHDAQGYYSLFSTCIEGSCTMTGPINLFRSLGYQSKWIIPILTLVSYYTNHHYSNDPRKNRALSFLILALLTSDNLIQITPKSPDIITKVCSSTIINIGMNNEFTYNVSLPCDLTLLENQKFSISPNSIKVTQLNQPRLHQDWKKVAFLKVLCRSENALSSVLIYDNYVPELDGLTNSFLGGKSRKHAELVTDPYDKKYVSASLGRFSLKRCSLIKAWANKAIYSENNSENQVKMALNDAIKENDDIHVRRHEINFKHTKADMKSLAFTSVKTSVSFIDMAVWSLFLWNRSKKQRICAADVWIFGIVGIILAPKFTSKSDVIFRNSDIIPEKPVITQWISHGNQIIWSRYGTPIQLTDYSKVVYALKHDFSMMIIYIITIGIVSEFVMLAGGYKSIINPDIVQTQHRNMR